MLTDGDGAGSRDEVQVRLHTEHGGAFLVVRNMQNVGEAGGAMSRERSRVGQRHKEGEKERDRLTGRKWRLRSSLTTVADY